MSKVKKIIWKEGPDKDLAFIDYKIASFYFGVTFVISVISAWSEFPALLNRLGNFWLALLAVVAIEILTNWFLNLGGFLMYLTFKKFSIGYLIGTIVFLSIAIGLYLGSRSLSNEGAGIRIDNYVKAPEKAEKDSTGYVIAISGLSAKEQGEISNPL